MLHNVIVYVLQVTTYVNYKYNILCYIALMPIIHTQNYTCTLCSVVVAYSTHRADLTALLHTGIGISHIITFTDVSLTPKDLPHLQTVLEEASGMWYPLGMKLKLDTKTLTGIATASGDDNSTAISFMLTRWLKSKDQPPLLQSLTASLCSPDIGLPHLSDTLMKDKHHYGQ